MTKAGIGVDQSEWERLDPEQKRLALYEQQVRLLRQFLEKGAISRQQYEKSFRDLTEKMGMDADEPADG